MLPALVFGIHSFCFAVFLLSSSISRPLSHVFGLPLSIFRLRLKSFIFHLLCSIVHLLASSVFFLATGLFLASVFFFCQSAFDGFLSWTLCLVRIQCTLMNSLATVS